MRGPGKTECLGTATVVNMHIVILVVLTTAVTEGGCCTIPIPPTAIEVDCQYKKLDSIPRLPPGIVKINLDGNRITSLDSRSFLGLTNLTHLYLGVNKISVIANGTFDELKSLQKLYLDENKISKIDPGLFSGLTNLTFMDLGYNNISFIPKGTFAELKSLQKLDLSDNNLNCDCDLKRALREVINRCVSLSTSSCIIGGCINKTTGERQTIWQFGNQTQCDIADCAINPCQNGGTCTDGVDSYTCSCAAGYSGRNCETEIDGCSPNPCKNGGTCKDWKNGYTCFCALGYIGLNCNTARITTRRVLSPNQTQEENITAVSTIATPQPKTTRRIISPNQTNEATRTDKPTKVTLEAKTTGVSSPHQPQEGLLENRLC